MKNKAQEEYFSAPRRPKSRPKNSARQKDSEQRIQYFKKAWQEGTLNISTPRLAQRLIDFETEVEPALPDTSTKIDPKH